MILDCIYIDTVYARVFGENLILHIINVRSYESRKFAQDCTCKNTVYARVFGAELILHIIYVAIDLEAWVRGPEEKRRFLL